MASNETLSSEDECDRDRDCLFVLGDGLFRVWHVILIVAVIALAIIVVLFRVIKCPRLPEESRKRKEREERRARGEDGTGSNLELNNTDNHLMPRGTSPYEGNVDQPLVPPGNVDLPLTPPYQQPPQDLNVVYNPSATNYQQPPPSATQSNRYSYDPSNTVELRYIRSRTTSEMGRDSYYDHHGEAPPTNDDSSHPIVSTSTRI